MIEDSQAQAQGFIAACFSKAGLKNALEAATQAPCAFLFCLQWDTLIASAPVRSTAEPAPPAPIQTARSCPTEEKCPAESDAKLFRLQPIGLNFPSSLDRGCQPRYRASPATHHSSRCQPSLI